MKTDYLRLFDKYYESGSRLREILIRHSRSVADLALDINSRKGLGLSPSQVEVAAMLHDIGVFLCDAPSIECSGTYPYICHGLLGGDLLRREGWPEWAARVAERHTGTGITDAEIRRSVTSYYRDAEIPNELDTLLQPGIDLFPETLLELLICYADKFYSKSGDMHRKSSERVRTSLEKFGPETLLRYDKMDKLFS